MYEIYEQLVCFSIFQLCFLFLFNLLQIQCLSSYFLKVKVQIKALLGCDGLLFLSIKEIIVRIYVFITFCFVTLQLVFEALHSQEPRGYVVGWIIAISLLVGILIFLLLAVLLWKVLF